MKLPKRNTFIASLFYCFIVSLLIVSIVTPSVFAQTAPVPPAADMVSSITSIPPRLEVKAKPGQTIQELIKLRNDSETGKAFELEIKDFIVADEQGKPVAVEEEVSGRWSLASWMEVAPRKVFVEGGATRSFTLVISVPEDALPGGHYAMVIYRPITEGMFTGTAAVISQEVTCLVYLQVEGPITEDASLVRFETDKKLAEYGPVKFFVEIKNLSDIHIRPKTKVVVENVLLSKITQRPIRTLVLKEENIFPLAARSWETELPGKWHFGQYRAELTAAYGAQGKALTGILYFWIVPYKVVAAVTITILLLIALILFLIRQSRKNKEPKKQPES